MNRWKSFLTFVLGPTNPGGTLLTLALHILSMSIFLHNYIHTSGHDVALVVSMLSALISFFVYVLFRNGAFESLLIRLGRASFKRWLERRD